MITESNVNAVPSKKALLDAAYRRAQYLVMLPRGDLLLSVDRYDPDAERRLVEEAECRREWALITPCNPRSVRARDELNQFYFNELRYELESRTGIWLKALNRDPANEWPDEPGFFLVDPDLAWVVELGRRFHQNAVVAASLGQPPRLIWLNDPG